MGRFDNVLASMGFKTPPKIVSPVPEVDTLNTPGKLNFVAQDQNRQDRTQLSLRNGTPAINKQIVYPEWMANAPQGKKKSVSVISDEDKYIKTVRKQSPDNSLTDDRLRQIYREEMQRRQNPKQSVLGSIIEKVQGGISAEAAPMPNPTPAPDADDFEKRALPILNKYQIPPSVGFGMRSAEGGKIGSNNPYNINAVDSNPGAAYNYETPEQGIEAFAKLITTTPRYKKAYDTRGNPDKMLVEIQNAGYAGDPKDWHQRKLKETPDFPYKTYSDFVKDTPGYLRYKQ